MNIGIDIGGTNIGAGLLDEDLDIIHKIEVPTNSHKGYEFVEAQIILIIEEMIDKALKLNTAPIFIGLMFP